MPRAGGVAGLFDAAVVEDVLADEADESLLWPEEEAALGPVVAGRRRDYVLGRRCARLALERLGREPAPVLRGPERQPLWPDGVVGAITHTAGYAAAVVATADRARSVGIDAEPDEPLPRGVLGRIARPEDRRWLEGPGGRPEAVGVAHPERLLFTIKEAVYKAWYPLAGRWLGFGDAHVTLDPAHRRFEVGIEVAGPVSTMSGRYTTVGGFVVAGIELPPPPGPS